jgi:hypothetical protein
MANPLMKRAGLMDDMGMAKPEQPILSFPCISILLMTISGWCIHDTDYNCTVDAKCDHTLVIQVKLV